LLAQENLASFKAIENVSFNSASVMMLTPWVLEVAEYAKAPPKTHDFGLHLVLTSEWKNYRWGPVSSSDKVPSLLGDHGYFLADCPFWLPMIFLKSCSQNTR